MSKVYKNRVYSVSMWCPVLARVGFTGTWNVINTNREALLKSLFFDICLTNQNIPPERIPLEQNQAVTIALSVFTANTPFAQAVGNIAVPVGTVVKSGTELVLHTPQQIKFNSFFIYNDILFTLGLANFDLLNNYSAHTTVVVELEDIHIT